MHRDIQTGNIHARQTERHTGYNAVATPPTAILARWMCRSHSRLLVQPWLCYSQLHTTTSLSRSTSSRQVKSKLVKLRTTHGHNLPHWIRHTLKIIKYKLHYTCHNLHCRLTSPASLPVTSYSCDINTTQCSRTLGRNQQIAVRWPLTYSHRPLRYISWVQSTETPGTRKTAHLFQLYTWSKTESVWNNADRSSELDSQLHRVHTDAVSHIQPH